MIENTVLSFARPSRSRRTPYLYAAKIVCENKNKITSTVVSFFMTETIKRDKFVSLTYTITGQDKQILERIDKPVNYIHGRDSQVIEKIEYALEGCGQGDEISVELNPEDGFGEHQPELTYTDDIENVPPEFRHVGAEVEFQNDKGESRIFRVSQIENGKLTVDGNHPFAGKVITYNIKVNVVRDATPDEMANGVAQTSTLH
jgi:FKBP-type peptidyl-prolyl cis-trans isomerase SlyD